MNGSDMRAKAAAMFGKSFMAETKPKPLAKNAAVASNKVSKARPIPAFKVGGPVKKMPFDVRPEDEGVTGSGNTPMNPARKETVAKTAAANAKNAAKPVKKMDGGRIGARIVPIAMRNPDAMGAGIGDMRASLGNVGGSMRPDYSGMQGRMMRDLDRESRMTGEAGTPKGVGLRVGARFKDGGKVDKTKPVKEEAPVKYGYTVKPLRVPYDGKPVKKATGGKVQTSADTAKKLATEMGGMKCGGKAGKYAAGGAGKMRKGQCETPKKK